jgi:2-dehydro-3-deoxygalactonokinase
MISSPLGLAEVPHIPAPAGIDELASAARWFEFEDVTDLPILLVPGVRSGPPHSGIEHVDLVDVMRGEETLCAGLNALGIVRPPLTVLNLGSHWKAIRIDREGRVESSVTSLSGELIHAVQMHTILASSVPQDRPAALNAGWVERGMALQRKSGLARALFCVRLLELARDGTPEDRLAFLVGAFIASDLDALLARGMLASGTDVAIIGSHAIPEAWQTALAQKEINTTLLSAEDAENAFVAALRLIAARSCAARKKQRAC